MVSSSDRLNYIFHYDAAVEMSGLEYSSRGDFITKVHDDSRDESREKYVERNPRSKVLDDASAAVIYDLEFDGKEIEVRLEYNREEDIIGIDMEDDGKLDEFEEQLSDALEQEVKPKARKATQV